MKRRGGRAVASRIFFLIYCVAMFWLLFGQRWGNQSSATQQHYNYNFIPFRTLQQYVGLLAKKEYALHAFINLFGNILMFVPPGYLLPKIWKSCRKFGTTFWIMLISILAVEVLQYISGLGSMDVDDLILNLLGVIMGYLFWKTKCRN